MKSKLIIKYKDSIRYIVTDKLYEEIWKDIIHIITIKQNNNIQFTYIDLITNLLCDQYYNCNDNDFEDVQYNIYLDYYDTILVFKVYNVVNEAQGIICDEKRYVINNNNEGNCIDNFIKKGVNPQIENIMDLVKSINERLPERQITNEYHNTWCYERDFTEISLIKKFAQKIVDNCNLHLERISEFYTKI